MKTPLLTLALPPPPALASALEAAGYRGALGVQRADGAALSARDQRAIEQLVRESGAGEDDVSDAEITARAVAFLKHEQTAAKRARQTSAPRRTKTVPTPAKNKAARMGRKQPR